MLRIVPSLVEDNRDLLLDQTWSLLGYIKQENPLTEIFQGLYGHDLLQTLRETVDISKFNHDISMQENLYNELNQSLIPKYFSQDELSNSLECCYDHGVLGAVNLASLLDTPRTNLVLKNAIRAIGIHNGMGYSKIVNIARDPIAFLLIICDVCQEWDRRIVINDKAIIEIDHIKLIDIKKVNNVFQFSSNHLSIVFEYPDADCLNETGWNYTIFKNSKENAFDRLRIPNEFPLTAIKFNIRIPHSHKLIKSKKN